MINTWIIVLIVLALFIGIIYWIISSIGHQDRENFNSSTEPVHSINDSSSSHSPSPSPSSLDERHQNLSGSSDEVGGNVGNSHSSSNNDSDNNSHSEQNTGLTTNDTSKNSDEQNKPESKSDKYIVLIKDLTSKIKKYRSDVVEYVLISDKYVTFLKDTYKVKDNYFGEFNPSSEIVPFDMGKFRFLIGDIKRNEKEIVALINSLSIYTGWVGTKYEKYLKDLINNYLTFLDKRLISSKKLKLEASTVLGGKS